MHESLVGRLPVDGVKNKKRTTLRRRLWTCSDGKQSGYGHNKKSLVSF